MNVSKVTCLERSFIGKLNELHQRNGNKISLECVIASVKYLKMNGRWDERWDCWWYDNEIVLVYKRYANHIILSTI